jgi:hypothetical protein
MRHARWSLSAVLSVTALALAAGCTHNHYYGAVPICEAPGTVVASRPVAAPVVVGSYCEVPASSAVVRQPSVVAAAPERANTVIANRRPPARVVLSEPTGNGRGLNAWRGRRDASVASTRISGTIDEDEALR